MAMLGNQVLRTPRSLSLGRLISSYRKSKSAHNDAQHDDDHGDKPPADLLLLDRSSLLALVPLLHMMAMMCPGTLHGHRAVPITHHRRLVHDRGIGAISWRRHRITSRRISSGRWRSAISVPRVDHTQAFACEVVGARSVVPGKRTATGNRVPRCVAEPAVNATVGLPLPQMPLGGAGLVHPDLHRGQIVVLHSLSLQLINVVLALRQCRLPSTVFFVKITVLKKSRVAAAAHHLHT
mmetsp:Transcript_19732/g.47919  ORF Transcript_19732/g.47919 Transcript_19732/m.47919 type:complete len:237 (+) Transcript_19732:88-798(+)